MNASVFYKKYLKSKSLLLLFLLFSINSGAVVTITAPSLIIGSCGTWPTSSLTLGNIIVTENNNNDISTFGTVIITAPANFEFTGAGTATYTTGANISGVTTSLTSSTTITITITGNLTNKADQFIISGITVRGITTASSGNVTRTGGTAVINGLGNGAVVATLTSVVYSPNPPTAPDQYRCGPGTVGLTASGGSYTYFWYDESTQGNLIGTGASFTTPGLSSSRPYYVSDGALGSETSLNTGTATITCIAAVVNSAQLFNITNNQPFPVVVTKIGFSVYYAGACPAQVFYRSGTYVGYETSSAGWNQVYNASFTRAAPNPQVLDVTDFTIPASSTFGVYVYLQGDPSTFISGAATYSDASISISGGSIECQISSPFTLGAGSLYSGYTVAGSVYYKPVFCESTLTECWALINSATTPSVSISPNTGTIICSGTNVTFTATPVNQGTAPTYQWYIGANPVGANNPVYSTSALVNGDVVSCVLTPSGEMCPSPATATSNAVTMSVLSPTTINTDPANTTLCQNGNTTLHCTSTPAGPYQWQVSANGGTSWTNITAPGTVPVYGGWNTADLTLTGADDPNNGYKYRCMAGCTPSNSATLTINPVSDPTAINAGSCTSPASITISASGAAPLEDYLWYDAVLGGSLIQNGGASYTTPSIAATTTYYVTRYNTVSPNCESYPRIPVQAIIYTAPTVTSQPVNDNTNVGGGATFSVVAAGISLSYQWQVSTNGGSTWSDITTAGTLPTYSGWTTSTLILSGVAVANNNYQYRCVVTGICSLSTNSNAGILTVNSTLTYLHPTTGIQSTYAGACMEATCSGNYYDNGGAASPYSTNINSIYRTFCPNSPLQAIRATVVSLDVAFTSGNCNDILFVRNGPNQAAPIIWAGCGTSPTIYTAGGAYSGGVFTSTSQSGCLTFTFSSGTTNTGAPPPWDGWNITLSCVAFAGGPSGTANNDCINSTAICSDISASSFTYGPGITSDACTGCVTSENFTEWYRISIATGGTLELEIVPNGVSDLDFALYQASNCGSLGDPIRCSYAARTSPGKTGMVQSASVVDNSEDVNGDQWVQEVNVTAGQTYFLMINEWNKPNPNQYTLNWTLTNGASFDCSILLPVSMLDFYAYKDGDAVDVKWVTSSEKNNDYFTIERAEDAINFRIIGTIDGAGNSNSVKKYSLTDFDPVHGTGYYRIKQTDYDGKSAYTNIIAVNFENNQELVTNIDIFPNPTSEYLNISSDRFFIDEPFEIYNPIGNCVMKGILNGTLSRVSLNNLDNGVYLFCVKGAERKKFLIVR